jgi:hypothetical protein
MRYRKIVWLLALVPLTALCMRLWESGDGLSRARTRAVKAPAISAAFQCYSNGVGGHKWAILVITNRDSCDLLFSSGAYIDFSNAQMKTEFANIVALDNTSTFPFRRGSYCKSAVEMTHTAGCWRLRIGVRRDTWRDKLWDRAPGWLDRLFPGHQGQYEGGSLDTGWIPQ